VLVDDDAARDCQPLSGTPADFLGRKKWIEYFILRRFRNTGTGICYGNFNRAAVEPCAHREFRLN
jgi:hypothetical protein